MMKCETGFGTYEVELRVSKYRNNGNLAVMLWSPTEGPFATITVNLCKLPAGYAYLDTNNCPWVEGFVKRYGLAEDANASGCSGYCVYPLYKFNMDKLPEAEV